MDISCTEMLLFKGNDFTCKHDTCTAEGVPLSPLSLDNEQFLEADAFE